MFAIKITDDGDRVYYFGGWEGSDTEATAGQFTYWKKSLTNPESYEYDSLEEVSIELELLLTSAPEEVIGLPDDFDYDNAILTIEKVREDH